MRQGLFGHILIAVAVVIAALLLRSGIGAIVYNLDLIQAALNNGGACCCTCDLRAEVVEVTPTSSPTATATPVVPGVVGPSATPRPDNGAPSPDPTSPPPPTNEPPAPTSIPPVPTIEPVIEETKKSCNRGLGNGSEGCDPGNSGGKPGKAGEDDG